MPRRGDDDLGPSPNYQLAVPPLTRVVRTLIIVLAVCLVAQGLQMWLVKPEHDITRYVVLVPRAIFGGQLWRLVTYPFVLIASPGDERVVGQVLWGGLALWMFGSALETSLGASRFVLFLVGCVIPPAIVACLTALLHPVFFTAPVNGVSDLALALTAGWGARFPNQRLAIPPISGKTMVLILLGIQGIMLLARTPQQSVALSFASIGTGWGLMRIWDRIDDFLDGRRVRARAARKLTAIPGGKKPVDKRYLN
jgi:membrane associated rhomboid family serine protease